VSESNSELKGLAAAAAAHFAAGRFGEAEAAYRAALAVRPGHPMVLHNLGVLAASAGEPASALRWFDAAIAAEPRYALAYYNRALARQALGARREAIADFARTVAIEPGHYASHRALAFLYLAEGARGRALDHFARTYELRRGEDSTGFAAGSLGYANRTKLLHDAEQFRYLAAVRRDGARFEALARSYEAVAQRAPAAEFKLAQEDLDQLNWSFNTAIAIRDAPELPEGALAPRPDREELVRALRVGKGAVSFDDLLTPRAFAGLRRFLLESTIWHDFSHIAGHVAAYLEDGLACPLLLQVADELRALVPELLGDHPLSQGWAFKAVEPCAAIEAHADDGAVSVNFWMTPTAANLDPTCGGMGVCLIPPPPDWDMAGYEADKARSVMFLEQNRSDTLIVPYRESRAVLFQSRLVHYSDCPNFSESYEDHRINITLLFGHTPGAGFAAPTCLATESG
jgi:tetratricopeptide (TPR) repeat protein